MKVNSIDANSPAEYSDIDIFDTAMALITHISRITSLSIIYIIINSL